MDIYAKKDLLFKNLKNNIKLYSYISFVTLSAIILLFYLIKVYNVKDNVLLIVFSILCSVAETFVIQMPKIGTVSVSFAVIFSAFLLTDPLSTALIAIAGAVLCFPYFEGKGRVSILNNLPSKTIFNLSQYIINAGIGSIVYEFVDKKINVGFDFFNPIASVFAIFTYIFLNTLLMSKLMSILEKENLFTIWKKNYYGMLLNVFLVTLLGIVLTFSYDSYGVGGIVLFFIPLMFARYTFKLYIDMRKNYFETINVLINAIEASDPYTCGHSKRVSEYSENIARMLCLPQGKIDIIKSAALLHDIGKIGIDKTILHKSGSLNNDEFATIKCHPSLGATIISDLSYLTNISDIIKHHHERNDGRGYPDGLSHDEIPIETSILTIADSFDAMTTNRPYRLSMSLDDALNQIKINSGTQFNPDIVDIAILALKDSFQKINN